MDLPFDVIREVLSYWEEERSRDVTPWFYTKAVLQPSLFSACLVGRVWNEVATQVLYRDVYLGLQSHLRTFCLALDRREELRLHVRSIFFSSAFSDQWGDIDETAYAEPYLKHLHSICPNIHARKICAADNSRPRSQRALCTDVAGWHDAGLLTHLELEMNGAVPGGFCPELSLPALEDLIIFGAKFDPQKSGSPWPNMPQLRRLRLMKCIFAPSVPCLPTFENKPKGLRAFEIIGGIYRCRELHDAIRETRDSLEILALLPALCLGFQNFLGDLRALLSLRILPQYASIFTPADIPPRLTRLIFVDHKLQDDVHLTENTISLLRDPGELDRNCSLFKLLRMAG